MTTKKTKVRPSQQYPELLDMVSDIALFCQKWSIPTMAKTMGISKQSLQKHIDKKKGKK